MPVYLVTVELLCSPPDLKIKNKARDPLETEGHLNIWAP